MSESTPPPPPPPPPPGPPSDGSGWGATPPPGSPPPPPCGYGQPAYGGPPAPAYSVGDALSFGWAKFQANVGPILLSGLVLLVGLGIFFGISLGISAVLTSDPSCTFSDDGSYSFSDVTGFVVGLVVQAITTALLLIAFQVISAGLIRAALQVTDGGTWQFSEVLRTDKIGKVLVAALLVAAITFVGTLLCYLPGIVAGFMLSYTMYFVVDRDLEPMAAVKASFELTKNNLGNTLVWYIVGGIVGFVGVLACGVGALVSLPVVLLGTAYTYRTLTGGTVVR